MWSRLPFFWRFQIAVWAAFVVITLPGEFAAVATLPEVVGSSVVHNGVSIVLTFGMRVLYDRVYQRHRDPVWIICAVTIVCVTGGFLQVPIFYLIGDLFPSQEETLFKGSPALGIFYYRTGLFTSWSLLYFAIKWIRDDASRELQMLRVQMNPHLLANAMQHIQAEVEPHFPKMGAMVQSLMNYLNYSLRHQQDDFITIGEEYDALMDFLELEKLLFGAKLDIGCQIESSLRSVQVPGVILQPLVENAVKYGLQTRQPPVSVRLDVRTEKSRLVIEVCNTGHWIEPNSNRAFGGVGLNNVQRRLKRIYGRKHRLETFEEEGWVTVRVSLPIKL